MKPNKALLGLTLFASLILFQSGNVYAGTFIQNVCWLATDEGEQPGEDDGIVKLGATDIGGGHYRFDGYVIDQVGEAEESPLIMNGSGEIIGGQLIMGLSGVMDDSELFGNIGFYIRINLSDLSGSFQGIGTFFDKLDEVFVNETESGTLVPTDCPA